MEHRDLSEIVLGLVITGQIPHEYVNPLSLIPPFDQAFKLSKEGADITQLYSKISFTAISGALNASDAVKDDTEADWVKLLDDAYHRSQLVSAFQGEIKRLEKGDDPDVLKIENALEKFRELESRYQTLDQIDPEEGIWKEVGYAPLDYWMGGMPDNGLTIIAGSPGTGKTSLLISLAHGMANLDKKVLLYTFEMTSNQIAWRINSVVGTGDYQKNIIISDANLQVEEVVSEASRIASSQELGFIGLDFADLMVSKTDDEATVGMLYRYCARLAKNARTPVVLLSQFNRETYKNELPHVNNIRWSGLAEAMASMILLLYNPDQTFTGSSGKESKKLPPMPGRAWIIVGKSRFGYGRNKKIGAINVPWDGATSWENGDNGTWKSLAKG